jgi:hypothetical protein
MCMPRPTRLHKGEASVRSSARKAAQRVKMTTARFTPRAGGLEAARGSEGPLFACGSQPHTARHLPGQYPSRDKTWTMKWARWSSRRGYPACRGETQQDVDGQTIRLHGVSRLDREQETAVPARQVALGPSTWVAWMQTATRQATDGEKKASALLRLSCCGPRRARHAGSPHAKPHPSFHRLRFVMPLRGFLSSLAAIVESVLPCASALCCKWLPNPHYAGLAWQGAVAGGSECQEL